MATPLPTSADLETAALEHNWTPFAILADAWVSDRLVDREAMKEERMTTYPQPDGPAQKHRRHVTEWEPT